jgi:hypothetical protein
VRRRYELEIPTNGDHTETKAHPPTVTLLMAINSKYFFSNNINYFLNY